MGFLFFHLACMEEEKEDDTQRKSSVINENAENQTAHKTKTEQTGK
jgi:hypothetical protein